MKCTSLIGWVNGMEKTVAKEENTTRAPHKMSEGISMACIGSK